MGIFKSIKRSYDEEYDLDNLEDLSFQEEEYDTEDTEQNQVQDQSVTDLVNQFERKYELYNHQVRKKDPDVYIHDKKKKALSSYDKAYEAKKRAQEEEERFDQLLNSVQAKDLMDAVDKINRSDMPKSTQQGERLSGKLAQREMEDEERQLEIEKKHLRNNLSKERAGAANQTDKMSTTNNEEEYFNELLGNVTHIAAQQPKKEKTAKTAKKAKRLDDGVSNYIKNQCKEMEDASLRIEDAMHEYNQVTRQFSDVQMIEAGPEYMVKQLAQAAERVDNLTVDRRMYKSDEKRLSASAYHRMEMIEDEFDKNLKYLEKEESYYEAVKRDMRILEGERLSLRIDAQDLTKRQLHVRKISRISLVGLVIIFGLFTMATIVMDDAKNIGLFLVVTFLSAVIAVGMFAIQRMTEREVLVVEKKLNRATTLLNKVKIKYINAANTLNYSYAKYAVKSSYELAKKFNAYLEMKEEQKKVVLLTSHLNEAEEDLQSVLKQLGVYDTQIWLTRIKALYNRNEMVEVRHNLTTRRQQLRKLIQDNEDLMEEAKENIMKVTNNNPEHMNEALAIIKDFERRNQARNVKKTSNY